MSRTSSDNIETTSVDSYVSATDITSSNQSLRTVKQKSPIEEVQNKFFNMVKSCDVSSVNSMLSDHKDLDINCKNYHGMTGLNLAIEGNCEPIIDMLLARPGLDIGDSLMYAIQNNRYSIVVKFLDMLQETNPEKAFVGYEHSAVYPQYLTPLMLAAQCGLFRIISLLLKRGHTIAIPHKPTCVCKEVCKSLAQLNNGLGAAETKLSVFRAISNPAYISLTSDDPILTSFHLSRMLRDHGDVDRIFKSDYQILDLHTRLFAVNLIGLCRSSAEVELILSNQEGCTFFGTFPYHRLVLAMDLKQKEFVAHAYVQQTLEKAWAGDWYEWKRLGPLYKSYIVLPRIVLLPYIMLLYLLGPYTKRGQHYALPVNRMLNYLASYVVFLVLLTYANNLDKTQANQNSMYIVALKWALFVYFISFVARIFRLVCVQGPKRYFRMLWNVYDCVKLAVFAVTFVCWGLSYVNSGKAAVDDNSITTVDPNDRRYWHWTNPVLIAEGMLAIATVMSYLRLLFLCQLSYALGPMQVSLGKMTTDFSRFAILFGIIILAFTAGLCRLYQYYDGMTQVNPVNGREITQDDSFVSVYSTLKTLFWGIFCMTSSTAGSVIIENNGANDMTAALEEMPEVNNHYVTQAVGTLLYAIFETLSVIIMLNMLIATMTNTFQRVTGNSYIEWVFGRTQVFLSFSVHTDLPPPLNLIPSLRCFVDTFSCLCKCCKAGAKGFMNMVTSKANQKKGNSEDLYKNLMSKLLKRYFRNKLTENVVRKCSPLYS
ncbi:short transient receptor potential channel 6-like [Adelges cooleyi]|uniref:short transient receptor potential channel 6-like n=1 Tax=Adelges cooleyi TaxID=133065 RepID=UPI00217F4FDD|nr:short transient receptor potential channel 6-like [Adelges cooleyi]